MESTTSALTPLFMIVAMLVIFYFFLIRPQRKRDKREKLMRDAMEVGDGVTTIGGVVGRVISMKEDTVLIETGSDRTKIRILKSAISEVEKLET